MKTIKYLALTVLVTLTWSCKKFLDREPISELTVTNFYEDADQIESGIFACYDGMQQTIQIEYMLTGIRSDIGTTVLNEGVFGHIDNFTDDPNNSILLSYWQLSFNTIMRANTVLAYIDVVKDPTLRTQFEAEARFIRAVNYFNLVRLFGDLPKIDHVILSTEEEYFTRVSSDEIYNFIKDDLDFASQNLPTASSAGRPNTFTAKAFLGKVYLTQGEYSNAQMTLADVINGGGYALQSNYSDVFDESNELNSEIIFAIEFKSQSNAQGQNISYEMTFNGEFGGLDNPTTDFVAMYTAGDTLRSKFNITEDTPPLCGKYLSNANPEDAGNDWPVLRLADVILMHGEATNELSGPTQDALDDLNETRLRAGLTAYTSTDITTKEQYREAMENERALELCFENHRWFDLLRTGRAIDVMANHGINVSQHRLLYPIPQREIDVSNGKLTQNSGY